MQEYSVEMPAELESLRIAAPFTSAVLGKIPEITGRDKLLRDLELVVSEALTNAVRHGESAGTPVRLTFSLDPGEIVITVTDHGAGFDPDAVAPPDFAGNPEGGYGVFIMKTIMDSVRYVKTAAGNNLILSKNWAGR